MLKYGKLFLFVTFILLSFTNTVEARRYYNPRLGIWLTTDPLSDRYPGWSPYNYALDNPLIMIDPDGRNPILFLQRLAQTAQRFGNSRTWQAARTYGDKAVNYLRRDWTGFTQKVRNLPSRVGNDAERIFNTSREIGRNFSNLFSRSKFSSSNIESIKSSVSRLEKNREISEGARAIAKKIGHSQSGGYKSAFEGLEATNENALKIVDSIIKDQSKIITLDKYIDVFNSSGQGMRIARDTYKFIGFLEETLVK